MNNSRLGGAQRSFTSSQSSQPKPAKGLWAKLRRAFSFGWLKTGLAFRKFKTVIWFGSTGLIFLVVPFAFSHFLEVSEELQKLSMAGQQCIHFIQHQQPDDYVIQDIHQTIKLLQQSIHSLQESRNC